MRQTWRPERTRRLPTDSVEARDEDVVLQSAPDLCRVGALEEELDSLLQVRSSFLDGRALARDVELRAERDEAPALTRDDRGEAGGTHPFSPDGPGSGKT